MLIYLLIAVALIILIGLYWWFTRARPESLEQQVVRYGLANGTWPIAYTLARAPDGTFRNVEIDEDRFIQRFDKEPINPETGTFWRPISHGDVTNLPDGYTVTGVLPTIRCPTGWLYNETKQLCSPPPICDGDIDNGYIRGITQYQFKATTFHPRLYARCKENGTYIFDACVDNQQYNQVPRQPDTVNPCVYYDICVEHSDGFKHKQQIDDHVLLPNEYYICNKGVSMLSTCEPPLVFSDNFNACIIQSLCFGVENNQTIPIDDYSFLRCLNDIDYKVNCDLGVFTGDGPQHLSCINRSCETERFVDFYFNDYVNIPTTVQYCTNNQPTTLECTNNIVGYNKPLTTGGTFIFPKAFFYDIDVGYVDNRAKMRPPACETIESLQTLTADEIIDPLVECSYNAFTPTDRWNWWLDKPGSGKYYNVFGKIVKTDDMSAIGDQKDYLPIMGDDVVYENSFGTLSRIADPYIGYSATDLIQTLANPTPKPEGGRLGLFMYMLFELPDGNYRFVYGNWVSNINQPETTINNVGGRLYVADCVPQIVDTVNFVKLNPTPSLPKGSVAPPSSRAFQMALPSGGGDDRNVVYFTSGLTWYGKFAEKQIQHHVFQPFMYEQIADFIRPGYFRAVATINDPWSQTIESLLASIDVATLTPTSQFDDPLPTHLYDLFTYDYSYMRRVAFN
jgi:hypothetical protein